MEAKWKLVKKKPISDIAHSLDLIIQIYFQLLALFHEAVLMVFVDGGVAVVPNLRPRLEARRSTGCNAVDAGCNAGCNAGYKTVDAGYNARLHAGCSDRGKPGWISGRDAVDDTIISEALEGDRRHHESLK